MGLARSKHTSFCAVVADHRRRSGTDWNGRTFGRKLGAEAKTMSEPSVHEPKRAPLGPGGWLAIIVLGCILGASIWFAFYGWNLTDTPVSTNGMIALTLGIVFSMLLGGGLMALVFWSNRKGYDR
jgi:hypothetical protein